MEKSSLDLSIFLATIGIFIPLVIQIFFSNFNYGGRIDSNLVTLRYLFLPAFYFIISSTLYFRKLDSKLISGLIMANVCLTGINLGLLSVLDKFDLLYLTFQHLVVMPFFFLLFLFNFFFLPLIILVISLTETRITKRKSCVN